MIDKLRSAFVSGIAMVALCFILPGEKRVEAQHGPNSPAKACTASIRQIDYDVPLTTMSEYPAGSGKVRIHLGWTIVFDCIPGNALQTLCRVCAYTEWLVSDTENGTYTGVGSDGPHQSDPADCSIGGYNFPIQQNADGLISGKWYKFNLYACAWDPLASFDCDIIDQNYVLVRTTFRQASY